MSDDEPTGARQAFGHIAPKLAEVTDKVVFGDIWRRRELSPRDRSLITVSCLITAYRTNELPYHMKVALGNGVTREELVETITHLAFYAGLPCANTAVAIADKVFAEVG